MKNKDKETLNDAVAHLNGYAIIIESRTGYKPVALNNCIKELKEMAK